MSSTSTDGNMETRIALIEKEFGIVHGIFQKFEVALDKMSESSVLVQKLLAVHDQRIDDIERRREEHSARAEQATQKIENMATELRREIRDELSDLGDSMKSSLTEIKTKLDESSKSADSKFEKMEGRVAALERWRWLLAGGGAVLGAIFAKWSVVASFFQALGS